MKWNTASTLALLIGMLGVFLCQTFGVWSSVAPLIALVVAVGLSRQRVQSTDSQYQAPPRVISIAIVWLIITVMTAAWRVSFKLTENTNYVFTAVDFLAHLSLFYCLHLWVMRPRQGHVLMLFFGMAVILLCLAAGGVSRALSAQTTVGVLACVGFAVGCRIISRARSGYLANRSAMELLGKDVSAAQSAVGAAASSNYLRTNHESMRLRAMVATVVVLMMVTGAVASVTDRFLPMIRENLQSQLHGTMDAVDTSSIIGGMRYVRGSRLGDIRDHLIADPKGVALAVYSKHRPGYLRGTVFDSYQRNRWESFADQTELNRLPSSSMVDRDVDKSSPGRATLATRKNPRLNRFVIADASPVRLAEFEIVGDPMRGSQTFLPFTSRWIEAKSSSLTLDHQGVIRDGIDIRQPYVAGAGALPVRESLSSERRRSMTILSSRHQQFLSRYLKPILRPGLTNRQKADAISEHFQEKFAYGLSAVDRPAYVDPVLFFLAMEHPAHCEYFATASVLLLRAAGVPARYVTGYVASELREDEDAQWLARNRDAHAWVEAYDDATQRWFVVESTPGRRYQAIDPSEAEDLTLSQATGTGVFDDERESGWLSQVWGTLFSVRATDTIFAIFRYGQIVLLVGLIIWLARRYRSNDLTEQELVDRVSHRSLSKVQRVLRRQGFVRQPSETVHHFAMRIEDELAAKAKAPTGQQSIDSQRDSQKSQARTNLLRRSANWLRSFADARYQGKVPPAW